MLSCKHLLMFSRSNKNWNLGVHPCPSRLERRRAQQTSWDPSPCLRKCAAGATPARAQAGSRKIPSAAGPSHRSPHHHPCPRNPCAALRRRPARLPNQSREPLGSRTRSSHRLPWPSARASRRRMRSRSSGREGAEVNCKASSRLLSSLGTVTGVSSNSQHGIWGRRRRPRSQALTGRCRVRLLYLRRRAVRRECRWTRLHLRLHPHPMATSRWRMGRRRLCQRNSMPSNR